MKNISVFAMIIILSFGIRLSKAEMIEVDFVTGEWAPYTSKKLPEYGATTELVSAICKAGGIKPSYKFYPWKRAEMMVERGDICAAFPYAVTEERKAIFDFSETMYYGVNVVVYNIKNPKTAQPIKFTKLEDLKQYSIGVMIGSFIENDLSGAGMFYQTAVTIEQNIKKLKLNRIDLFIDEQVVIYDMIKKLFPNEVDNFKVLPEFYGDKKPNALIVSRKYKGAMDILKKFNEGLAIIKSNGEYDRITNKHMLVK